MTHPSTTVSIVIPCYNHGQYIQEALDSIEVQKINYAVEIIIVDDGSSDAATLQKLDDLKALNYTVIHQTNGGPGKARNAGIQVAMGKYILPLDADNKISPDYINKAVPVLEKNDADIVYAAPQFFGDTEIKNTHQEIAYEMHTSRVVISRLLKALELKGKIKLHRNKIEILQF